MLMHRKELVASLFFLASHQALLASSQCHAMSCNVKSPPTAIAAGEGPSRTPRVQVWPLFTIKMSTEMRFSAVPTHLPVAANRTYAMKLQALLTTALLSQCLGTLGWPPFSLTNIPPKLREEVQQEGVHLLPVPHPQTPGTVGGAQFWVELVAGVAIRMLSPSNYVYWSWSSLGPAVTMRHSRQGLAVGNTLSRGLLLPGCQAPSKLLFLLVQLFLVCKMMTGSFQFNSVIHSTLSCRDRILPIKSWKVSFGGQEIALDRPGTRSLGVLWR